MPGFSGESGDSSTQESSTLELAPCKLCMNLNFHNAGTENVPRRDDINKILIIGSGPIVIGQACEFDFPELKLVRLFEKRAIGRVGQQ